MRIKHLTGVAVAIAVAVSLAGCVSTNTAGTSDSDSGSSKDPIILGVVMAGSGFMAPTDTPVYNAMKLEVAKINADGGVDGAPLKLDFIDTATNLDKYAADAQQAVTDGAKVIIATCDFDIASPAAQVAEAAGLLNISCASDPLYGPKGGLPLGFSFGDGTPGEASIMAEFANSKGWKSAAFLTDTTLKYTTNQCAIAETRWKELGGTVSYSANYVQGDSIAESVSQISAAGEPDVVFNCGYNPGGAKVAKDLRDGGITAPIISGNAMDGDYWTSAISNLNDYFVVTQASINGDDESKAVNDALAAYTKKYKKPTAATFIVGTSTIQAIVAAHKVAKSWDGAKLAKAMEGFKDEPLAIGNTTFRSGYHISVDRKQAVMEIVDGKLTYVKSVAAKKVVFEAK